MVSGIMDDGTGNWLDGTVNKNKIKDKKSKDGKISRNEEHHDDEHKDEAAYLANAIGACEAAFRNTDGVLFARISHVNQSIKVSYFLSHFLQFLFTEANFYDCIG